LAESASRLDGAGQRSAAAGEWVANRLDLDAARSEAVLQALPDIAAEITAASAGLRNETSAITAAVEQISAAGTAAAAAVTDVAALAERSGATLDTAGRAMTTAHEIVGSQLERLADAARHAEAQASLLPNVADCLTAAAARLQAVEEAWQSAAISNPLPDAVARVEAAAAKLERLDGVSSRLETAVAGLPAEQAQADTLSGLSTDIAASVRRVEAALAEHEALWPSVAESFDRVQAAAAAVAEAAASQHDTGRRFALPAGFDVGNAPAAVITTLQHFDEVACQSEMLLQQAEALAEAVLAGRAPGLPALLADRAPALLTEIDATTRRLRSVATAMALASDGVLNWERKCA
jgi:chromosome segregation ATPase